MISTATSEALDLVHDSLVSVNAVVNATRARNCW